MTVPSSALSNKCQLPGMSLLLFRSERPVGRSLGMRVSDWLAGSRGHQNYNRVSQFRWFLVLVSKSEHAQPVGISASSLSLGELLCTSYA